MFKSCRWTRVSREACPKPPLWCQLHRSCSFWHCSFHREWKKWVEFSCPLGISLVVCYLVLLSYLRIFGIFNYKINALFLGSGYVILSLIFNSKNMKDYNFYFKVASMIKIQIILVLVHDGHLTTIKVVYFRICLFSPIYLTLKYCNGNKRNANSWLSLCSLISFVHLTAVILKNEIGWFDDTRNTTSMLSSRLETDATLLKTIVVDRSTILL